MWCPISSEQCNVDCKWYLDKRKMCSIKAIALDLEHISVEGV